MSASPATSSRGSRIPTAGIRQGRPLRQSGQRQRRCLTRPSASGEPMSTARSGAVARREWILRILGRCGRRIGRGRHLRSRLSRSLLHLCRTSVSSSGPSIGAEQSGAAGCQILHRRRIGRSGRTSGRHDAPHSARRRRRRLRLQMGGSSSGPSTMREASGVARSRRRNRLRAGRRGPRTGHRSHRFERRQSRCVLWLTSAFASGRLTRMARSGARSNRPAGHRPGVLGRRTGLLCRRRSGRR